MKLKSVCSIFLLVVLLSAIVSTGIYLHGNGFFSAGNASGQKLPVILYHSVLPEEYCSKPAYRYETPLEDFRAQMQYLYDNGYTSIDSKQLVSFLYEKKDLPPKSILITFDDGFLNNLEFAYPILKEFGFHAVEYVITSYVGEQEELFQPGTKQFISREGMARCADVFEYQSHTYNLHRKVDGKKKNDPQQSLLTKETRETVLQDIRKSLELPLMRTESFAYPYGAYSQTVVSVLRELDFQYALTIKKQYVTQNTNPLLLGRFMLVQETTMDEFVEFVSGDYVAPKQ